jgi:hypothetical protein
MNDEECDIDYTGIDYDAEDTYAKIQALFQQHEPHKSRMTLRMLIFEHHQQEPYILQEPLYGLPLSAHLWQLSTDATWPYSCGAITFEY